VHVLPVTLNCPRQVFHLTLARGAAAGPNALCATVLLPSFLEDGRSMSAMNSPVIAITFPRRDTAPPAPNVVKPEQIVVLYHHDVRTFHQSPDLALGLMAYNANLVALAAQEAVRNARGRRRPVPFSIEASEIQTRPEEIC
jgi:hypothetical protein